MGENIFILKKTVNWSMLTSGFNISVEERGLFQFYMKEMLVHGVNRDICVKIGGKEYKAKLKNINFDENKWVGHPDILQIRYSAGSALARKLQSIFNVSYTYLTKIKAQQINRRQHITLPADLNEYIVLSATDEPYVFVLECITNEDVKHLSNTMSMLSEEEFEYGANDQTISERVGRMTDPSAAIDEQERIVKVRKIDRSIIDNLKFLYDYRCQITGEKVGERFGHSVIEAHHIDYFTHSQNNDISNIVIISPDYHRIIHRNNPHFNYKIKCFEFENGEKITLKLNRHL